MILYNHPSYFKSGEINSCRLWPLPTERPTFYYTLTERPHNLWSVTERPPIFWLLLSPKDPYVWGAWWHLYVTLIYECPPPPDRESPFYRHTRSKAWPWQKAPVHKQSSMGATTARSWGLYFVNTGPVCFVINSYKLCTKWKSCPFCSLMIKACSHQNYMKLDNSNSVYLLKPWTLDFGPRPISFNRWKLTTWYKWPRFFPLAHWCPRGRGRTDTLKETTFPK